VPKNGDGERNQRTLGIYRFDGETIQLCWAQEGKERPKEFSEESNERTWVTMTLKKAKSE
jgi:hypothetical protein